MDQDFDAQAFQLANDTSLGGLMRCVKARRLRDEGYSDADIATQCRIPVRLVQTAIDVAEDRHPPVSGDDLTEVVYYMLTEQLAGLQEIFRNPGFKHDVKGDIITGPDEMPEPDTERQIQAQREISRVLESIRKLKGTDAPQRRYLSIEEISRKETAIRLIQTLKPGAVAALEAADAEIIYRSDGPSLRLGDGGLVPDEEDDQRE